MKKKAESFCLSITLNNTLGRLCRDLSSPVPWSWLLNDVTTPTLIYRSNSIRGSWGYISPSMKFLY